MGESKSLMRNVRFTPAELDALQALAEERSCSLGAVVRWAVRKSVIDDPPNSHKKNIEGCTGVLDGRGAHPLSVGA